MCLTSNDIWMTNVILTKALVKKLETNQRATERKMINAKLKDRILNTIIRVADIAKCVTNSK